MWHLSKYTVDDNTLAEKLFQQAINLDPCFSGAYLGLVLAEVQAFDLHRRALPEVLGSIEALAHRAVAMDGANPEARLCLAELLFHIGDFGGALSEARYALGITPNLASAHGVLGKTLIFSGRPKEGIAALKKCFRLDPQDPTLVHRLNQLTSGYYFYRDYGAAIEVAMRATRSYPDFPNFYRWLAAALGQVGRIEEAKNNLEKAIKTMPISFQRNLHERVPWMRPEDHAHILGGLRRAGWRE